jgi:hypothetical protein
LQPLALFDWLLLAVSAHHRTLSEFPEYCVFQLEISGYQILAGLAPESFDWLSNCHE